MLILCFEERVCLIRIALKTMGRGEYSRKQAKRFAFKIIRVRVRMLHSYSFFTTQGSWRTILIVIFKCFEFDYENAT